MSETLHVLMEVMQERTRQDDKWGQQFHDIGGSWAFAPRAERAKRETEQAAQEGTITWRHILFEEFWEAFAEEDPIAQRAELVQVAAVAVAMIECIDRKARLAVRPPTTFKRPGLFITHPSEEAHASGDGARSQKGTGCSTPPSQDAPQDVA